MKKLLINYLTTKNILLVLWLSFLVWVQIKYINILLCEAILQYKRDTIESIILSKTLTQKQYQGLCDVMWQYTALRKDSKFIVRSVTIISSRGFLESLPFYVFFSGSIFGYCMIIIWVLFKVIVGEDYSTECNLLFNYYKDDPLFIEVIYTYLRLRGLVSNDFVIILIIKGYINNIIDIF